MCHTFAIVAPFAAIIAIASATLSVPAAGAEESTIRAHLREYFSTPNDAARAALVNKIESDPNYDRTKLAGWLHTAGIFKPMRAGREEITADCGGGRSLRITLRIPDKYDADKAWPLIYALHGSGGNAGDMLSFVERLLGARVDEFVLAAPDGYEQFELKSAATPYFPEHSLALRAVRHAMNIDSERVVGVGYSRGGHAAWTLAITHPDQFAGLIPLAGTLIIPEYDVLFETFLPNLSETRVLACYGMRDDAGPSGEATKGGGIAGVYKELRPHIERLALPVIICADPTKGHAGIVPPPDEWAKILGAQRVSFPRKFQHTFRLLEQAPAYWLEPLDMVGSGPWADKAVKPDEPKPGENDWDPAHLRQQVRRSIVRLLGSVQGEIDGNTLKISRKNIKSLNIWVGDGMIDWSKPVAIRVNGSQAYAGSLAPDLALCLSHAAESYDFERLRWAGVRFESGKKATLIRAARE